MEVRLIKKHLVKFLKLNGALGAFLLEYPTDKKLEEWLVFRQPSKFFTYADTFLWWKGTRQGEEFWSLINWKWEEYCKKYNIKND